MGYSTYFRILHFDTIFIYLFIKRKNKNIYINHAFKYISGMV